MDDGTEVSPTIETALDAATTLGTEDIPNTEVTSDTKAIPACETMTPPRPLDQIQEEFRIHYRNGVESAYQMGKLLIEAKAQLTEHGMWLDWLRSVNYPERQAQRLMRLAKGYPDPTTLSDLGQSKALVLLKIDEEKREEFINKSHTVSDKGVLIETNVHKMNVRQLGDAVREYNGIPKKNVLHISTSQTFPLMSHDDALDASECAIDIDGSFDHIHLCLDGLIGFIEGLEDSPDERGDFTAKLRELLDEALQRIIQKDLAQQKQQNLIV